MNTSFRWRVLVGALFAGFGVFAFAPLITIVLLQTHLIMLHVIHIVLASITGTLALIFGMIQIRRGLSPFVELRERLADVKDGRASRLEGRYPSEVQPLANELNAFLAHREMVVQNAIARAGDLAHGLKTPLAILMRESERARAAGHAELATVLDQQIERMRRQIEYHLAHARASSGPPAGTRTPVLESVQGLIRVLQRLYADRQIEFDVDVNTTDAVRVSREDFDEILGNLLDNACKWTRSRIAVKTARDGERIAIIVDDDGAGISPSMREAVLQRGVRADEAAPGSGLGLAIAREITELYGGKLTLEESPMGGLRARVVVHTSS
jgi:signal transduction histidine kinase